MTSNPYEPPPTGEEPQAWPRIWRSIRLLSFFTIAGGIAGVAFGGGNMLSELLGIVVRGQSIQELQETIKDLGLGGVTVGALLGSVFALFAWLEVAPSRGDKPLFPHGQESQP